MSAQIGVLHATLTLNAAVQNLGDISGLERVRIRRIQFTAGTANAAPIYYGGKGFGALSSSNFGGYLPAASGGVPPPPDVHGEFDDGTVLASQYNVLGANNEKLHLCIHAYV